MKKIITSILFPTVLVSLTILNSCKNNENVTTEMYKNTVQEFKITVNSSQWIYDSFNKIWTYEWINNASSNNSAILGYVFALTACYQSMPYYVDNGIVNEQYDFGIEVHKIKLQYTNYISRNKKPSGDILFKIVIIQSAEAEALPNDTRLGKVPPE